MKALKAKTFLGFLAVTLVLFLAAGQGSAGFISEAELNALSWVDRFEDNFDPDSDALNSFTAMVPYSVLGVPAIDSTTFLTDVNGTSSDGRLVPGVTYQVPSGSGSSAGMQWTTAYKGLSSQAIHGQYSDRIVEIVFDNPVDAFGVNVLTFSDPRLGGEDDVTVRVVLGDGTEDVWNDQNIVEGGSYFFAYDDTSNKIDKIIISGDTSWGYEWSPIIDDVTFGTTVVPIPGAVWLLGSGLACLAGLRRRQQDKK